ncbi:MAG TPA: VTT domain-containing protein [Symbiobacteriaceae bacterium]|jgi:membrane protein DedA with SNARE-associated domain
MAQAAWFVYKHLGLSGAGLIFMLEGLGAPVPVEIPLGIIGLRMAHELNTYWEMVLLMWLTTVVGNAAGYLLGYYGGRPVIMKLMSWFRIREELWLKVDAWFRQHGLKVVVATRWTNWGFAQNMWLCGITRVRFGKFLLVMVLNDLLWAMGWSWLSRGAVVYFRRRSGHFLHMSAMRVGVSALLVTLVVVAVWLAIRWWQRRRHIREE